MHSFEPSPRRVVSSLSCWKDAFCTCACEGGACMGLHMGLCSPNPNTLTLTNPNPNLVCDDEGGLVSAPTHPGKGLHLEQVCVAQRHPRARPHDPVDGVKHGREQRRQLVLLAPGQEAG
jgi:hypothetical protein